MDGVATRSGRGALLRGGSARRGSLLICEAVLFAASLLGIGSPARLRVQHLHDISPTRQQTLPPCPPAPPFCAAAGGGLLLARQLGAAPRPQALQHPAGAGAAQDRRWVLRCAVKHRMHWQSSLVGAVLLKGSSTCRAPGVCCGSRSAQGFKIQRAAGWAWRQHPRCPCTPHPAVSLTHFRCTHPQTLAWRARCGSRWSRCGTMGWW